MSRGPRYADNRLRNFHNFTILFFLYEHIVERDTADYSLSDAIILR